MASPGLIVDRDGTLVYERGYLVEPNELVPFPGVEVALRKAKARGVKVAMVTNQSAVGRGLVTELGLDRLHHRLRHLLPIDSVYVCPHLPDAGCPCRKPEPQLVSAAVRDLHLDPRKSLLVGDHLGDCLAARAVGIDAVLVRTGHGAEHAAEAREAGFRVVADLPEAVELHLASLRR